MPTATNNHRSMLRYIISAYPSPRILLLIISAHLLISPSYGATRKASWRELLPVLNTLPSTRSTGTDSHYHPSEAEVHLFQSKLAELSKEVDIIPAVAKQLETLAPSSEEDFATISRLIMIADIHQDGRLLNGLGRVAKLPCPFQINYDMCGGGTDAYPYRERSNELYSKIGVRMASETLERALAGLTVDHQMRRLASYAWGFELNEDDHKRQAAGQLLQKLSVTSWGPHLVENLPDVAATDETSKRKLKWMLFYIDVAAIQGFHTSEIDAFVNRIEDVSSSDRDEWVKRVRSRKTVKVYLPDE